MSADAGEEATGPTLGELIARVVSGRPLAVEEAEAAFRTIMDGRATAVQIAALLVALRTHGESALDIAGGVRALRGAMVAVEADAAGLVDTCGTGGGRITTFNISTAAALLAAGAGVRIAKHGNRSFTSRCGSADVLAELGVRIELSPQAMARVLDEAGIVFMFAPLLHPAMRHVAPVRRELGFTTIMNVLGPLTNPAGARRQVVGVADPALLDLIADALFELGHERALVVHGEEGLDELSPIGITRVAEVRPEGVRRYALDAAEFFDPSAFSLDQLAGGDPVDNARIVSAVLDGSLHGAARAAVTLNAGAALYVAGRVDTPADGILLAERVLDEGGGSQALERLRTATRNATA